MNLTSPVKPSLRDHQKKNLIFVQVSKSRDICRFLLSRGGQILRPKIHKVSFGKIQNFLIQNFRFYVSQFENVKIAQIVVESFQFFRAIEILNDQDQKLNDLSRKKI